MRRALNRLRPTYDWVVVVVAALAMVATLPGRTHGLGLITEPLLTDLGLDRTVYADINLAATLLGAAFCWPAGALIDRFGVRRVLTAIAISLGSVVVTMTQATQPVALFVLITLTRALGQSMLSVASLTLIGKTFSHRPGPAMGAYSLLIGLGFSAAFKGTGQAVLDFGWRATWSALGWLLIAALAPIAWCLVREPSRDPLASSARGRSSSDFTVRRAFATRTFWVFGLASSMYGLVSSGIGLFSQAILDERGFRVEIYHTVLAVTSMCGMLANLSGGWAAGRLPLGRLMAAAMGTMAASLAALPLVTTTWQVYAYAVMMGTAGGLVTVLFFTVWGVAFGQTHLGKIQGWAQMMTVVASAIGPKLFAEWHARTASYAGAFYLLAPAALALGVAAWFTKLPCHWSETAAPPQINEETELTHCPASAVRG